MTNPNIPPEIDDATTAPAPVRISPEVRETIRIALILQMSQADYTEDWRYLEAMEFVEALP